MLDFFGEPPDSPRRSREGDSVAIAIRTEFESNVPRASPSSFGACAR